MKWTHAKLPLIVSSFAIDFTPWKYSTTVVVYYKQSCWERGESQWRPAHCSRILNRDGIHVQLRKLGRKKVKVQKIKLISCIQCSPQKHWKEDTHKSLSGLNLFWPIHALKDVGQIMAAINPQCQKSIIWSLKKTINSFSLAIFGI